MRTLWSDAPRLLQEFKQYALDATGLGKDALHIYAGLFLIIGIRLVWRRRGGWLLGWLAALAAALAVEWLDVRAEMLEANLRPDAEHWKDIWNTMFWPTVLLLTGSWLHPRAKQKPEADVETSGDLTDEPLEQPPSV